jgi:hypothetical protein
MTQTDIPSRPDTHWRNRRTAFIALVFSVGMLWATGRDLHKQFPIEHVTIVTHWALGYGTILMLYLFWRVRCMRERLWLGIALSYDAMLYLRLVVPNLIVPATGIVRALALALWVTATLLSLFFVVSAMRKVSADPNRGTR